ncbi:MAG: glycosyltransferase family 2 protein [Microscillaceae bacterium]|nr:glycosyltransferase family 2 protein [Microscillaceae bacterium]MDW8459994.1 glycosyltransferase family 2 protein [Cytophagales bacterium]
MDKLPLVSIGIPVYNEERFLAKTIESAISQTYPNLEIIISDNCSTDESFEIAQKYANKDKRIVLFRQPENMGSLKNFYTVLKRAKGMYFCWLGAHDIFLKNYIQIAIEIFAQQPEVVMVYPISRLIDVEDRLLQIEGSDIHTAGLPLEDRLCKVVSNLNSCVAISGVFKSVIAKKLPFKKVIGSDHLMLFATAFWGGICEVQQEGIYRRVVRQESHKEVLKRYEKMSVYSPIKYISNPYSLLVYYHYTFLLKQMLFSHPRLCIRIIKKLEKIFQCRFGVETREVKRIFWNNLFLCKIL